LRDEGVSYGDYLEQLTYLLFLKLAHEYAQPPFSRATTIPSEISWSSLLARDTASVTAHYNFVLSRLAEEPGALGEIFAEARNKVKDGARLRSLLRLIDSEKWLLSEGDLKGDLYEGLLQRNAEDTKSGAGQYFTPRPLAHAIMRCVQPAPMRTVYDPACGTGGFFLSAHDWLLRGHEGKEPTKREREFLRLRTFHGNEIVASTRALCLMNLFLHGIGDLGLVPLIERGDALACMPSERHDYIFANPPFGRRSGYIESDDREGSNRSLRPDFVANTSNKQLNFVQHIVSSLKENGRAAVVVPDNVLFEAGAGEAVRSLLINRTRLHTILRLPTGIFYAQGVKANVLFFDGRKAPTAHSPAGIWVYDLRTDGRFRLKSKPLTNADLDEFVAAYRPGDAGERVESDRFRFYPAATIASRERLNLDLTWRREDHAQDADRTSAELTIEIIDYVQGALAALSDLSSALEFPLPVDEREGH